MYTAEVCQIVTKFGVSQHIVIKFPNTKFCGNPSIESRADTCGQTDGHDEGKGVFRDCECVLKGRLLIWKDCRSERTIRRECGCGQKGNAAGRRRSARHTAAELKLE